MPEHLFAPSLHREAIELLKKLIATTSFSGEEHDTASLIDWHFRQRHIPTERSGNNIIVRNRHFTGEKPVLLLQSHHDTVRPNPQYTRNPFEAVEEDGKLYGLGSNDAGGALVSLMSVFMHFYERENLAHDLIFIAGAEEENSGKNGLESVLPTLGPISFAIIGEPTLMDLAVAEKGLLVIDCVAHGKAGHAAREEGENAIYKAMHDIEWFRSFRFPRVSDLLGEVKMSVTIINAGSQHNVVPAECRFTVDIRVTEQYTFDEVLEIIRTNTKSEIIPRSTRLKPSSISPDHPFVKAARGLGKTIYGSATCSDQALLNCPSAKMGPGDSARSHTADEFIYISEIKQGIHDYIAILNQIIL